jgi:hypothetical protein
VSLQDISEGLRSPPFSVSIPPQRTLGTRSLELLQHPAGGYDLEEALERAQVVFVGEAEQKRAADFLGAEHEGVAGVLGEAEQEGVAGVLGEERGKRDFFRVPFGQFSVFFASEREESFSVWTVCGPLRILYVVRSNTSSLVH